MRKRFGRTNPACWVNYRNLYLSQTNSKAWCEKYLRNITPTEVRFV